MTLSNELHPLHGAGLRKLLALLVVTLNLRGAITCVGPLLETLQAQFNLSGSAAGLLTSLPLFAFGFLSPYAAPLARKIGMERAIFVSLLLLLFGLGLRYMEGILFLYLGTAFIGTGIAISNVLLPGLLRRDFAQHLALVTALFTVFLVTCGGLGSGISYPLAQWKGWQFSMVIWALPVLLALIVWAPQLRQHSLPKVTNQGHTSLWNQALAWHVSLFMACQSTAFYVMIAWFPSMMSDLLGIDAARSGLILFVYQIAVLFSVMLVPILIHKLADQRGIGAVCAGLILLAFCGLLFNPAYVSGWMIVMGLGAGGSLVLSMTLFGLRSSSATQSVALSGMAQSVGYLMAALTPILIGFMHDLTDSWTLPLLLMIALSILQVLMGYLSGRPLTVHDANA